MNIHALILYPTLFISLFFEVFLLITYLEVKDEIKAEDERVREPLTRHPSVTVIVPCYNEEATVGATVKSILDLEYPKEKLHLILVNDGSTDGTLKILKTFASNPQIKVIDKKNGGKHTAVNRALEEVETELVGCLDSDSFVMPDALRKIIPYFDDPAVMAVTPSIKVHEPKNALQYIQKTEYAWSIFLRRMLSSIGALYVTPGPFSIFKKQVFDELGPYRYAHMTEDMEMAMRMQKNHYKIVNSHGAHVYTVAPATLKDLVKQRTRWTYGFLNNGLDYKSLYFNPQYGNFGMFIMPIATVSYVTSFVMVGNIVWGWAQTAIRFIHRYQAVGFNTKLSWPSFDWYFLNTGILSILVAIAVGVTLLTLYLSIKMADGKFKLERGLFYYLFLYTFMVPLWLMRSIFDTIFKRKVSWR